MIMKDNPMKRPFIKICGLRDARTVAFLSELPVDAIGFISYRPSPRYISEKSVMKILASVDVGDRLKVGVFVNESIDTIKRYRDSGIGVAQLHGDESAEFAELCVSEGMRVWKALRPRSRDDLARFRGYPADKFLVDAFVKNIPGGTGCLVERALAVYAKEILTAPLILAGGINPTNALGLYSEVEPFGIDVNSGVEKESGVKDFDKILSLLNIWNSMD